MNKRHYMLLILLLFLLQIADGILTYLGVTAFGTTLAEGNILVRAAMDYFGVIPGLLLVKIIACVIILIVYNNIKAADVTKTMVVVLYMILFFYVFAAVAWLYFLL